MGAATGKMPKKIGQVQSHTLELHESMEALEADWRALTHTGTSHIYQDYDWVKIALETIDQDNQPFIITGRNESGLQFILPLVLEHSKMINTVRWIGKTHCNTCCGIFSEAFLKNCTKDTITAIVSSIGKQVPGIGVLHLKNQIQDLGTTPNPFLYLPNQRSVSTLFDLDITIGLDGVLELGNAKRKRKLFRRQVRVADKNGGFELFVPQTYEEIEASVDDFLLNKAKRFKEMGVRNVFESPEAIAFMKALAHAPMRDGVQPLRIYELRIGGKTRAMYGCGMYGDYCQSCVNSVTYDELSEISPGEMIVYLLIEQLIADGFKKFDLGVGKERYKVSWCREPKHLFDTLAPLSKLATVYVHSLKLALRLKSEIRDNSKVWNTFKKVRKSVGALRG